MYEHFPSRSWFLAVLLSVSVTACMAATSDTGENGAAQPVPSDETRAGNPAPAQVGAVEGQGPFVQFIVKYRDNTSAFRDEARVQARVDASSAGSGLTGSDRQPLKLIWQRRMGVGADVLKAGRPLDRDEAGQLMQAFASDPDVEYIEIDGIATHQKRMGI